MVAWVVLHPVVVVLADLAVGLVMEVGKPVVLASLAKVTQVVIVEFQEPLQQVVAAVQAQQVATVLHCNLVQVVTVFQVQ